MRGVRVRLCYGILLLAVSLWWVQAFELDDSSSVSSGQPSPKRSPHTKSVPPGDGKPATGKSPDAESALTSESDKTRNRKALSAEPDTGDNIHDKTQKLVADTGDNIHDKTQNLDEQIESIKDNGDEQTEAIKPSSKNDGDLDGEVRKRLVGLDNRIVDRPVDRKLDNGKGPTSQRSPGSNSVDSRLDSIQTIIESSLKKIGDTHDTTSSGDHTANNSSDEAVKDIQNDGNEGKTSQNDVDRSPRTLDSSSTEPIPAESKVYKEFSSRFLEEKSFPFVTTARGSNVMTTTTSRSVKIEEVTEYSGEEEGEGGQDEEDNAEEKSKKKLTSGPKDQTTLRTGKILAGQKSYDPLSGAPVNHRKSAFTGGGGYGPPDIYGGGGGGVFRKPVNSYYETALPGVPTLGGRKPSPFEVRKPLYSATDTNYGGGGGGSRRPSLPFTTHPGGDAAHSPPHLRRPQDFSIGSAGKNPFLSGAGGSSIPPSLGGTQSVGGSGTSRRPYTDPATTGRVPFSGGQSSLGEGLSGLSAYAERPDPRPDSGFRARPKQPSAGGFASEPFINRPSSLSRPPELEGGFRPLDGGFRPLVSPTQGLTAQQVYKQRVRPQRPPQVEAAATGNVPPGGSGLNLNNIGLNMLYKETNVLNQDFTSAGGEGGDFPSSSSAPVSPSSAPLSPSSAPLSPGDSNLLDLSGSSQGGSESSGGGSNRTRVRQSTPASPPFWNEEEEDSYKRPAHNSDSEDSVEVVTTETAPASPTHPTRYKIRKPSLLSNTTRKGAEVNAIPQEATSRKPVVKNNLKTRLGPSRTKVPSTTSPPPPTTTLQAGTTDLDDTELEGTTSLPVDTTTLDTKPNAVKPIIGFNQRKRPPGKHSYPGVSGADTSTTLSPVKVSSHTRVRKPSQQAAFTTEAPTTLAPVKKIKPFVNWASRLQKGTTTENSSEEITTVSDEDFQTDENPATSPSYGLEPSTSHPEISTAYLGLTPSQSTTPVRQTSQSTTPFEQVSSSTVATRHSETVHFEHNHSTNPTNHGAGESSSPTGRIEHSQSTISTDHGAGESSSPTGHIGHSQSTISSNQTDETTTAKLFENTIPSKLGEDKYSKVPADDEREKGDSQFTVKDFISKFQEDPPGGESLENAGTFGLAAPGDNATSASETSLKPLSGASSTTARTNLPSSFNLTTHFTTQTNHPTTVETTLPNEYDRLTTEVVTKPTSETTTETVAKSTSVRPIASPPVAASDGTSLANVDMSDDMSSSSDGNIGEKKSDSSSLNDKEKVRHENEATKTYISITTEKESAESTVIDVKTRDPLSKGLEENKQNGSVGMDNKKKLGSEMSGNKTFITSSETNKDSSSIKTVEDATESETTRSKVPTKAESETNEPEVIEDVASRHDVISRIPTSAEEASESGTTTVLHTSTRQSTTLTHLTSDPWRSDFSDDFWSKFESTTENNWSVPKKSSDKTTVETPWLKPVPTGQKEPNDSNPVLSSISVTPPTEGTTVSMTTGQQSTKKPVVKSSTPNTVLTTGSYHGDSSVNKDADKYDLSDVSMETDTQSSVTMTTSKQTSTTSTVLPPRFDLPTTSKGDFYSEDVSAGAPPSSPRPPSPPSPPYLEEPPRQLVQLAIHSTPGDICSSLPGLAQAVIALFQYGSMRVQSPDQLRVKDRDLLCSSPETKEQNIFLEFYLTDGMGEVDRDINEEFLRLYTQHGGLDTDLMITDAHLSGEEPIRDEISVSETPGPAPEEEPAPRVVAAIVIAAVAGVCGLAILLLLLIMRKKGRSFNNRQRCIPVSLDDYSLDNVSVYHSSRRKSRTRASKRSYGNPGFEDPNVPSNPLSFPALSALARDARALAEEFARLPQVSVRPSELPPGVEDKNRYANVIPIPETRVPLSGPPGETASLGGEGYINANYVSGPKNEEKFYIACQAPLQGTIEDFWHMVWTHQSRVILMLTALFENSVEKCADYLPPSEVLDCHRVFGDYQITLKKREVREKYVLSHLQIKNLETNLWRELTHVWYTSWPSMGVPSEEHSLIAFLLEARAHAKPPGGAQGSGTRAPAPLVVHCSPGTGRTGAVIACDMLVRQFETARSVDVPAAVSRVRRCRAGAVATAQQYAFIYRVISAYATKLTGGVLDSI